MLGSSSGHAPFASFSRSLMILSRVWFVTSIWLLAWGDLGMRIGSWFLALSRSPWNLDYQIATCCLIWSSLVSQIGKLYSSTRSSGPSPPLWLIVLLLQPILWNNQWQLVKILPVFYLGVMGQWCQVPTGQMATGRLLSSVSQMGCVGRSQTSSICRTSWRTPLHPFVG